MKRILRGAAIFAALAGVLVLAWALTTVLWQEPFTSIEHAQTEKKLESKLDARIPKASSQTVKTVLPPTKAVTVVKPPPTLPPLAPGEPVGRLTGPHISAVLTYGRDHINDGPGMWNNRPGYKKTVVISGHRTTYGAPFRDIDQLQSGDKLTLRSPWGTWRYSVYRKVIVAPTDLWVIRNRGFEQIVLTACHPVYSAAQRYVVFAKLDSYS